MNAQYATVCSLPVEQCQIQVQRSATQCSTVQISSRTGFVSQTPASLENKIISQQPISLSF
jgi:hypothetical protein